MSAASDAMAALHAEAVRNQARYEKAEADLKDAELRGFQRGIEAAAKRIEEFRFFSGAGKDLAHTIRALTPK
jgi:hypothetical protein